MNKKNTLPGEDDIIRIVLENGITVLTRADYSGSSVVINGFFPAGSILEPEGLEGLTSLMAIGFSKGTEKHTEQQISEKIESCGASLGFASGTSTIAFSGRSLPEDLPMLLNQLFEILDSPTFPEEKLEQIRSLTLTGLALREQSTSDMSEILFDHLLFGNHPYGRDSDGSPASIARITRDDLLKFHQNFIGPEGMVICVVGNIDPQKAVDSISAVFGSWKKPVRNDLKQLPVFPIVPPQKMIKGHHEIPEKSQLDLMVGSLGPSRTDPDYIAGEIGNEILGQFGMMGRIGKVVRDQNGLAYYADSDLTGMELCGEWSVSAGVNPQNLNRALDLILKEIRRFSSEPVTPEELDDVKTSLIGQLPLSMESNQGVARALLKIERFNLGLNYYRELAEKINVITAEDVLCTASRYLIPDKLVVATAGTLEKTA